MDNYEEPNFLEKVINNSPELTALNSFCYCAKKEIEHRYQYALSHKKFKETVSDARRKWYYSYLHTRIERKAFLKSHAVLFDLFERLLDKTIPLEVENSFDKFVDFKESTLGERI